MHGVRPIGIGEVSRRIVNKAIISIIYDEIKQVAGTTQLCAGLEAGCEIGIHSMRALFEESTTEGALFVDASNALNLLNRQTALLNIHSLCPALAVVLTNTYRNHSCLFIEGQTLLSREGTTQGDRLATAMYTHLSLSFASSIISPHNCGLRMMPPQEEILLTSWPGGTN